jgi:hypothetical protein
MTQQYSCVVIPAPDADGNLPAGVYPATWDELSNAFGQNPLRAQLLDGLYRAAKALQQAGCSTLYVDGSFVTTKDHPKDVDACWEPAGVNGSSPDPVLLDFRNRRIAQKVKYGGELFISSSRAEATPPRRTFLEFFQSDKDTGKPKGIIAIDLRRLP